MLIVYKYARRVILKRFIIDDENKVYILFVYLYLFIAAFETITIKLTYTTDDRLKFRRRKNE